MTEQDQIQAFSDDLEKLIYRYRDEFDLTIASMVGVLECAKFEVMLNAGGGGEYEVNMEK
jgi:hypothetical protein